MKKLWWFSLLLLLVTILGACAPQFPVGQRVWLDKAHTETLGIYLTGGDSSGIISLEFEYMRWDSNGTPTSFVQRTYEKGMLEISKSGDNGVTSEKMSFQENQKSFNEEWNGIHIASVNLENLSFTVGNFAYEIKK